MTLFTARGILLHTATKVTPTSGIPTGNLPILSTQFVTIEIENQEKKSHQRGGFFYLQPTPERKIPLANFNRWTYLRVSPLERRF
jgi:hypothetical protein